jgi:predicted dienelactone hydrolase
MKPFAFVISLLITLVISSCNIPPPVISSPKTTAQPIETAAEILPTTTTAPTTTFSSTSTPVLLRFSQMGSFYAGSRYLISYVDETRGGRNVILTIWYPAVVTKVTPQPGVTRAYKDEEMDLSAAPYPLIITTTKAGNVFGPHLASYGFVVVGINDLDTYRLFNAQMVQQPLDYLFVLDKLADDPPDFLAGNFDVNKTGVMGYSFDGLNSLFLSGARVYPEFLSNFCDNLDKATPPPEEWYSDYICNLKLEWNEFETLAGKKFTGSGDGLWKPLTDPRIIAVMPMAADGAKIFGDLGLAAADRPALMIAASEDEYIVKESETDFIFDHLGSADKTMIMFVGQGHMMIYDVSPVAWMRHFATAFFGYHLQGKPDYAYYYSSEYLAVYPQFMLDP